MTGKRASRSEELTLDRQAKKIKTLKTRIRVLESAVRATIADLHARAEDGVVGLGSGIWVRLNDAVGDRLVTCPKCDTVTPFANLLDGEACPKCKLVL